MQSFKEHIGLTESVDEIHSASTAMSRAAVQRILFERLDKEFCVFVPKTDLPSARKSKFREAAKENGLGLYSVAVISEDLVGERIYIAIKNVKAMSEDFRDSINQVYDTTQDYSILYYNGSDEIKILHEDQLNVLQEEASITKVQRITGAIMQKDVQILGVEIPLSEKAKASFKSSNLIEIPLTEEDASSLTSWSVYLRE